MVPINGEQLEMWIAAFLWPFIRILAMLATAPVFDNRTVQRRTRVALAAMIAMLMMPILPTPPTLSSAQAVPVLIQQILIGVSMGFSMRLVFAAFEMAGDLLGLQMGLAFAQFIDPSRGTQTPLLGSFLGVLASLVMGFMFDEPFAYRLLVLANFVTLCNLWLVIIFLSGMKAYNRILLVMLVGYSLMVLCAFFLRFLHMNGLLLALLIGHGSLLFMFLFDILREYPAKQLVAFDFLQRRQVFISLLVTGFCYNLGIWIDKFIFWFNPQTSSEVIGPLRASMLYDLPIFLAYLAIIPGMAVFLVRIETDFAEWYERVYSAIRGGQTLQHIGVLKEQMILAIRQGLLEICKVQGLTVVLLFLLAPAMLEWLGISAYYLQLFYVDLIGVSIQVVFMALLNVFFYLDKRAIVLELCVLFVVLNAALTLLSQYMGPTFYGYGFTLSLLVCVLLGLMRLSSSLEDLEYETFMLSR